MRTLRTFKHLNARTVDEAVAALKGSNARVIAGGTDLLGAMRAEVLRDYPETVINLRAIAGLDYIREEAGVLKIGSLTRLADIASDAVVDAKFTALAQAARKVASPHIREMATLGGNICQFTRCWYFRKDNNRFDCIRKGGRNCFALYGDNRYHSIFGLVRSCGAVNPSDTAPALVVLNARIVTSKRTIEAEKFWDMRIPGSTILDSDEIVTAIHIPAVAEGVRSSFVKFALRKSIDFPIVNCAASVGGDSPRICLNAVHNKPFRAVGSEAALKGRVIDADSAEIAAQAAVADAKPLPGDLNKWKIQLARAMVKRAVLACI